MLVRCTLYVVRYKLCVSKRKRNDFHFTVLTYDQKMFKQLVHVRVTGSVNCQVALLVKWNPDFSNRLRKSKLVRIIISGGLKNRG